MSDRPDTEIARAVADTVVCVQESIADNLADATAAMKKWARAGMPPPENPCLEISVEAAEDDGMMDIGSHVRFGNALVKQYADSLLIELPPRSSFRKLSKHIDKMTPTLCSELVATNLLRHAATRLQEEFEGVGA
ncbi:hypothetical protein [Sinorhizobium meliloti]|uniref:hypothetical protein n=1 Tax=Rhizobium meliloti TaxID=382 RepID=UPI000FE128E9|nr:hypothetical protein [Sinorhizobium meliloti]RVL94730.1 hypothetical protein CN136_21685 [Sinorhizobium meliloti]